jgi:regulator of sigma E protease
LTFLEDVLALVVILSVVVFVHEFGHFAVAKIFRFPVEVFSFGFGKRLFGVKIRGTDYRISALPLGGYVRIAGLGPDESTAVGASEPAPAAAGPRWKRALIMAAGPFMNFVLAVLLQAGVFVVGIEVPAYRLKPPVVEAIAAGSPGAAAGFRKGDRILSIDGSACRTWEDAEFAFAVSPGQRLPVEVDRAGATVRLFVVPLGVTKYDLGVTGVGPALRPRINKVLPRSPASEAGLQAGDVIVSVDGDKLESVGDLLAAEARHAPGPETFAILRAGKPMTLLVSPRKESDGWKIGVATGVEENRVLEKYPPVEALRQGWRSLRTNVRATFGVLAKLFVGKAPLKQMSGPIAIGQFAGEAAREGAVAFVALMAALSLQLGILNLLPVPLLDGGQLAILLAEGAIRRDFSIAVKERILQVGFALLVLLMVAVLYNDIRKIF